MREHLSIFMENKPGMLERLTRLFSESKVNIIAFSIASGGEFGVAKFLLDQPKIAYAALKKEGIAASLRPVVIPIIQEKIGGLHELLLFLREQGINIEDSYGFLLKGESKAAVVLESKEERLEEVLIEGGYEFFKGMEEV